MPVPCDQSGPSFVLQGGDLVLPGRVASAAALVVRDGRIHGVGEVDGGHGLPVVDATGHAVLPGLIDLHVHGARGSLIGHGENALEDLSTVLAEHGVTGFLPTLAAVPLTTLLHETRALRANLDREVPGAVPLGLNLEGPFLNPWHAGALPPGSLCTPDRGLAEELVDASDSRLGILTLAPELEGALDLVEFLAARGVVVAAGHTEAPFAIMEQAVSRGLAHVTHCYNAMAGSHHRRPGPVEAALTLDALTVEVIADGLHVQKPALDILLRCKELGKVALISDATALGMESGEVTLPFGSLTVARGAVLDPKSGGLVGSARPNLYGVKALQETFNIPLHEAVRFASEVPARILGLERERGSLEPGKRADFFLLGASGEARATYVGGRPVYSAS